MSSKAIVVHRRVKGTDEQDGAFLNSLLTHSRKFGGKSAHQETETISSQRHSRSKLRMLLTSQQPGLESFRQETTIPFF